MHMHVYSDIIYKVLCTSHTCNIHVIFASNFPDSFFSEDFLWWVMGLMVEVLQNGPALNASTWLADQPRNATPLKKTGRSRKRPILLMV